MRPLDERLFPAFRKVLKLQLEFDAFQEVPELAEAVLGTGVDEQMDDVTAEARDRRRRFGANVPTEAVGHGMWRAVAEVRLPETKGLSESQLQAALRRRGLPWHGEGGAGGGKWVNGRSRGAGEAAAEVGRPCEIAFRT